MADCSNTPTPESTANFDLDSRCFSEAMTSNSDYTTSKASDGNVKKTFAAALREAGWEHVGEWSTNPLVTESNQVIPYAGTNQLFRPLSLPYQVDSAANPNPNALLPDPSTGYAGELVDVSQFVDRNIIATESTSSRDIEDRFADELYFEDFGATGAGVLSDSDAIKAAIEWVSSKQGRKISGRRGSVYAISEGIVIPWDGKFLDESSACTVDMRDSIVVPIVDNITAFKSSRNYVTAYCPTVENRNNKVGIEAFAIAPEDYTQSITKVSQMYNEFFNPVSRDCDTHFRFQPGPTVGGQNSGAYYHDVWGSRSYGTSKGFHFARCVTGDNLNTRINVYSPKQFGGNCMFDIEAADTLDIYSGTAEFVNADGDLANKPTIKIHKPVVGDALSSSVCTFHNFKGEVGNVPFDIEDTESCSMPNAFFYGYAEEGVTGSYSLTNMWQNEGAIFSRAAFSSQSTPMIGARRDVGANAGQVYLTFKDESAFPAEFYADRGFNFASPINNAPIADLQNTNSNSQILGTALARYETTGSSATGTVTQFNTSSKSGRGFAFGGVEYIGPQDDNVVTGATSARRYKEVFSANGVTTTSDGTQKTPPVSIDGKALDAWGDVSLIAFKWLDAVASKGSSARTHFGVIAQQVRDAFLSHGLDGTKYGLLCYDEWKEERDEDGNVVINAGSRWGIRSDQCLFLEAAYQRRENERMKSRLDAIENKLASL